MNGVNLIPAHRLVARRRAARARMWMYIAPACITALSGSYGYLLSTWETSSVDVQDRLAALEPRIAAAEAENAALKAGLQEARAELSAANSIADQPDWGLLAASIAQRLGEEAVLTEMVLEPAPALAPQAPMPQPPKGQPPPPVRDVRYRLTLSGLALTQDAVTRLALALADADLFDGVKLVESKRSTFSGTEAVAFRVECSITDQAEGRDP